MSNKIEKLEIRSDDVQEILGYVPHWIVKSGISVIFSIILLLFIGCWYFKYPDIISSQIVVTSENPAVFLIARTNGKISKLLIADNKNISKGEVIAVIENTSNYMHVIDLRNKLDSLQLSFIQKNPVHLLDLNPTYQLGSLQNSYSSFLRVYTEYLNFIDLNFHNLKIKAINRQLQRAKFQTYGMNIQSSLMKEELELSARQFRRDSILFVNNILASSDFEKSKRDFIMNKYEWQASLTSVISSELQLSQMEQSILDLKLQKQEQMNQLLRQLKSSYDILRSEIDLWAITYLFQSPIDGKVSFSKIWSQNQNIMIGEAAFSVVPKKQGNIIGKLQLPISGSGKVKPGQIVNIRFNSFPSMEYGTIQGNIKSIAIVPEGEYYLVTVELPQSLKTNYGKVLPFSQQMHGSADIITERVSILERIFNPLRVVFKKYQ